MNSSDVLKIVDYTLLAQTATWADVQTILKVIGHTNFSMS